jgi:hypothetical protein
MLQLGEASRRRSPAVLSTVVCQCLWSMGQRLFGAGLTVALVANSAAVLETRGESFAGGLDLPRLRLGDLRRDFATSVTAPKIGRPGADNTPLPE